MLGSAALFTLTAVEATAYSNEVAVREIVTDGDSGPADGASNKTLRVRTSSPGIRGSGGDPGTVNHGMRVRSGVNA